MVDNFVEYSESKLTRQVERRLHRTNETTTMMEESFVHEDKCFGRDVGDCRARYCNSQHMVAGEKKKGSGSSWAAESEQSIPKGVKCK